VKKECLARMIFFGEQSLRKAVGQFLEHYHRERNHQGLGNHLLTTGEEVGRRVGVVQCRERLGGLLRYFVSIGLEVGHFVGQRPAWPMLVDVGYGVR
jgi:putative transposase